jgi:hypothetical protein
MAKNGTIDTPSIVNNNTYYTNPGVSITHIINGMAGNIESHSTLDPGEAVKPLTAVLDRDHYGFSKMTVVNATTLTWTFVKGGDGSVGDSLTLIKRTSGNGTAIVPSSGAAIVGVSAAAIVGLVGVFALFM